MATEPPRDRRDVELPYAAFGAALKQSREQQGLSRQELAESLNISYPMLANVEAGRRRLPDDRVEPLAELLGLPVEELRALRDVTTSPRRGWRLSSSQIAELARDGGGDASSAATLGELTDSARSDQDTVAEALLTRLLQQSQELDALARASTPTSDATGTGRSVQLADVLRQLRELDNMGLTKVHAFVQGLLAAQDLESTAVDPTSSVPLVRVPAEPFGPLQSWTAPQWMRELPGAESARDQADGLAYRDEMSTHLADQARSIGRRVAIYLQSLELPEIGGDRGWPPEESLVHAAQVGIHMRPRGRIQPGFVDAHSWLEFVAYRPRSLPGPKWHTTFSNWLTAVVFVGGVTRPHDIDAQLGFVEECLQFAGDLFLPRILAATESSVSSEDLE